MASFFLSRWEEAGEGGGVGCGCSERSASVVVVLYFGWDDDLLGGKEDGCSDVYH